MSAAPFAVFAMLCFSICATAQTRTLEVYLGEAHGLDSRAAHSLQSELERVLAPAEIKPAWRSELTEENEFGEEIQVPLVVGSFRGDCSVDAMANLGTIPARTLAESAVSDGRILPYFQLDCTRILRTLAPTLQHLSVPFRAEIFGRALARVMAHEIYHILSQTKDHDTSGLAKSQLSLEDLTSRHLDLSPSSLDRMRTSFSASRPSIQTADLAAHPRAH